MVTPAAWTRGEVGTLTAQYSNADSQGGGDWFRLGQAQGRKEIHGWDNKRGSKYTLSWLLTSLYLNFKKTMLEVWANCVIST